MGEVISGVPLGLSRDYEQLSRTGPLRAICCQGCARMYEDAERLTADGCRVLAVMCERCREEGCMRWLAEKTKALVLPTATAKYRNGDR